MAKIHIYSDICKEIEEKVIDEGFFYLTRPLLLGEAPPPLLNPPLLRREGLKAWAFIEFPNLSAHIHHLSIPPLCRRGDIIGLSF